jgi:nucleoid-associated protein YgaU
MGLFSFIKEAGEKLFGSKEEAAPAPTADPAAAQAAVAAGNAKASQAIANYIRAQNLDVQELNVAFDGSSQVVTVSGTADQTTKEKVVLCCGNVQGVAQVNDQITVSQAAPESRMYTVVKGDTLSKVAKEMYGNANDYMKIFEANKPMLSHPDKIYPGQVLRIPQ